MQPNKIALLLIFLFSFLVRIWNYNYPPLTWDEASLGYNSYSISQTLRDEYGTFLPLIFKSFGDYKPGLYIYLASLFTPIFGLTELSVRLPSIILGSLTPILLFYFVFHFSSHHKILAYLSALVLAANPYNIHFSRGAWETNILTFELILASYLFFKFRHQSKYKYLLLSSLVFAATLYTYQAGKLISFLLVIVLWILHRTLINKKNLSVFFLPLTLLILPIIFGLLSQSDANRLKVVSLLSYPQPDTEINQIQSETSTLDYQLFHSRPLFFLRQFLFRYFNHFSPRFLTFEGDWQNPRHSAPYIGMLLFPSCLFLVLGIIRYLHEHPSPPLDRFFFAWFLLAPIPAALTRDTIQAVRAMSFSIPLTYFISLGLFFTFKKLRVHLSSALAFSSSLIILALYLLSFSYYLEMYFNHLVKIHPTYFTYGYKQAVEFVLQNQGPGKQVIFSDFYGQPYIFYLYYSHYPPQKYFSQARLAVTTNDTGKIEVIDNVRFSSPSYELIKNQPNTVAVFSFDDVARQGIDKLPEFLNRFIPLSPVGGSSTFYGYIN